MKDWTGNNKSTYVMLGASNHTDNERQNDDYYATNPHALELLLDSLKRDGIELHKYIWECACGQGHLSNTARLEGNMMDDKDFIINYLDKRYNRIYDLPLTVGEVAGAYPDNILLITMYGHITCSKYGIVYDSFDCRDRFVEYCWIVK